jgi:hypothetical protein
LVVIFWTKLNYTYFWDQYVPFSPGIDLHLYSYPWLEVAGHGVYFPDFSQWYLETVPYWILWRLGVPVSMAETVVFFAIVAVSGIGSFEVLLLILKRTFQLSDVASYVPATLGATLYAVNTYVVFGPLNDDYAIWMAYAIFPIFALSCIRLLEVPNGKSPLWFSWPILAALSAGLLIGLVGTYPPLFGEMVILAPLVALSLALYRRSHSRVGPSSLVVGIAVLAAILVFATLWDLPVLIGTSQSNLASYSSGNYYWAISNIRLTGAANPPVLALLYPVFPAILTNVVAPSWISFTSIVGALGLTLMAFVPLTVSEGRRAKFYLMSVVVFLIASGLLSGFDGTLGIVYRLFYVPGSPLLGFQNLTMSLAFLALVSKVLCFTQGFVVIRAYLFRRSLSIDAPRSRLPASHSIALLNRTPWLVTGVAVVLIVSSQAVGWSPYATPNYDGISANMQIPNYYLQLANYLEENSQGHVVLGLPVGAGLLGLNWSGGQGGFIGNNPIQWLSGVPTLFDGQVSASDAYIYYNEIYTTIEQGSGTNFASLLSSQNIKYVVLQTNFVPSWEGGPPAFNLTEIHEFLNNQPNLELVKEFGPEIVYENLATTSLVFTTSPIMFNPTSVNPLYSDSVGGSILPGLSGAQALPYDGTNGQISFQGTTFYGPDGLQLNLTYPGTPGANHTWIFYPSSHYIGVSTNRFHFVEVTYKSSDRAAQLYLMASNQSYGVDGHIWWFLTAYNNSDPSNTQNTVVSSLDLQTAVFALPASYPEALNYLGFGITLKDPNAGSLNSVDVTNVTLAGYTNRSQWGSFLQFNGNVSDPPALLFANEAPQYEGLSSPSVSYIQRNPSLVTVRVANSTGRFLLTFAQTYANGWCAVIGGRLPCVPPNDIVNGFAMGWLVNQTGTFQVDIEFESVTTSLQNELLPVSVGGVFAVSLGIYTYTGYFIGRRARAMRLRPGLP